MAESESTAPAPRADLVRPRQVVTSEIARFKRCLGEPGRAGQVAALGAALIVVTIAFSLLPWQGSDWDRHFRPGALSSPWAVPDTFTVPWLSWLLWPLALLPPAVGKGLLGTLSVVLVALYARKKALWVAASAGFVAAIWYGQPEALVLVGLMWPAASLLFLSMKPQGVFLAGLKRVTPVSVFVLLLAVALSIAVYGAWFLHVDRALDNEFNLSLFPWSAPIAVAILAWKRRKITDGWLCLASLCLAPYWWYQSLLPVVAAFVKETERRWLLVAIVALTWVMVLVDYVVA